MYQSDLDLVWVSLLEVPRLLEPREHTITRAGGVMKNLFILLVLITSTAWADSKLLPLSDPQHPGWRRVDEQFDVWVVKSTNPYGLQYDLCRAYSNVCVSSIGTMENSQENYGIFLWRAENYYVVAIHHYRCFNYFDDFNCEEYWLYSQEVSHQFSHLLEEGLVPTSHIDMITVENHDDIEFAGGGIIGEFEDWQIMAQSVAERWTELGGSWEQNHAEHHTETSQR